MCPGPLVSHRVLRHSGSLTSNNTSRHHHYLDYGSHYSPPVTRILPQPAPQARDPSSPTDHHPPPLAVTSAILPLVLLVILIPVILLVPSSSPSWSPLFLMSKSVSGSVRARVGRRNSYSSCRPSSTSQDSRLDYCWQERGDEDEEAVFTDSSVYRQRDFRLPVPWFGFRCLCIDKLTSSSRQPTLGNSSTTSSSVAGVSPWPSKPGPLHQPTQPHPVCPLFSRGIQEHDLPSSSPTLAPVFLDPRFGTSLASSRRLCRHACSCLPLENKNY